MFESPKRLINTLTCLEGILQLDRKCYVIRELTKIYQDIRFGTIIQLLEFYNKNPIIKGEIILIIDRCNRGNLVREDQIIDDIKSLSPNFNSKRSLIDALYDKYNSQVKRSKIYKIVHDKY
ncbi:MAG TPA: hypothetical protein QKA14_01550 [Candidatus Megaira endosymbiont of Hartmannula sinica]|nr:hypothetical protein [Candidatus Megaera endosymbiont of Hartmannula sinica]